MVLNLWVHQNHLGNLGEKKSNTVISNCLRMRLKNIFFNLKISEVILNIQLGLRFTYFFSYGLFWNKLENNYLMKDQCTNFGWRSIVERMRILFHKSLCPYWTISGYFITAILNMTNTQNLCDLINKSFKCINTS